MLTGFHGFHVTIGAIMLIVMLFRVLSGPFHAEHHFAFEASAWYWHFVDVVWLLLFVLVYWLSDAPATHARRKPHGAVRLFRLTRRAQRSAAAARSSPSSSETTRNAIRPTDSATRIVSALTMRVPRPRVAVQE